MLCHPHRCSPMPTPLSELFTISVLGIFKPDLKILIGDTPTEVTPQLLPIRIPLPAAGAS